MSFYRNEMHTSSPRYVFQLEMNHDFQLSLELLL